MNRFKRYNAVQLAILLLSTLAWSCDSAVSTESGESTPASSYIITQDSPGTTIGQYYADYSFAEVFHNRSERFITLRLDQINNSGCLGAQYTGYLYDKDYNQIMNFTNMIDGKIRANVMTTDGTWLGSIWSQKDNYGPGDVLYHTFGTSYQDGEYLFAVTRWIGADDGPSSPGSCGFRFTIISGV